MDRFDHAVSLAEEMHRQKMEEASDKLLEAILAAREGREPGTDQFLLWGR